MNDSFEKQQIKSLQNSTVSVILLIKFISFLICYLFISLFFSSIQAEKHVLLRQWKTQYHRYIELHKPLKFSSHGNPKEVSLNFFLIKFTGALFLGV